MKRPILIYASLISFGAKNNKVYALALGHSTMGYPINGGGAITPFDRRGAEPRAGFTHGRIAG
jgi:hypothetical protein